MLLAVLFEVLGVFESEFAVVVVVVVVVVFVSEDVLLFDNPTQGIDVGTKFEIYHLIAKLAEQGKAIIVFSAEFPEIYKVADKCIVLYKGSINAVLNREELTEKNIMYYSTGANLEVENHA